MSSIPFTPFIGGSTKVDLTSASQAAMLLNGFSSPYLAVDSYSSDGNASVLIVNSGLTELYISFSDIVDVNGAMPIPPMSQMLIGIPYGSQYLFYKRSSFGDKNTALFVVGTGSSLAVNSIGASYNAAEDVSKISSIQKRMRDDFIGSLDTSKWDFVQGAGDVWSFTNGAVLTKGVTPNSSSYLLSKSAFTMPARLCVGLTLSQRIVNQTFLIELVSVDPVTQQVDDAFIAAWLFDSTSATSNKYRVVAKGQYLDSGAVATTTTAGGGMFEIESSADEVWFHSNAVDVATARAASFRRNIKVPDPDRLYKIRIRAVNSSTAPASSTTLTIPFIAVEDYAEITAEIVGARGNASGAGSLPVTVANTPNVSVSGVAQVQLSPQTSSGGFTNFGKIVSTASTNGTSIKGSNGTLGSMVAQNVSSLTRYLKLFNKASAPSVGVDAPFHVYVLPPNSTFVVPIPAMGWRLGAGIAIAITGGISDTDATAIGAGEVVVTYAHV